MSLVFYEVEGYLNEKLIKNK